MIARTLQLIFLSCVLTLVVPGVARAASYTYSYYGSLDIERNTLYEDRSALYDGRSARTVGPGLQRLFGPRSAGIRYDTRMIEAAEIAAERAHRHSTDRCWHSVKNALLDAQVVPTRPTTEYAKEAGAELQEKFGFTKLRITSPFDAPVGAVLVYGGRGAGHVEIRTATGFVSDFISPTPSPRPLIGIYVKPS